MQRRMLVARTRLRLFSCWIILSIFCAGMFTATGSAQTITPPSAGDGSVGNPYQISSLANLNWISDSVNQYSHFGGKYFVQTQDIDASATSGGSYNGGMGFSPIQQFSGNYDGQGHVVNNLFISNTSNLTGFDMALFGTLSGGDTIRNVGVTHANITGYDFVGALVGQTSTTSVILNCYSTGVINAAYGDGGGLVGENDSQIYNSYSTCTVTGGSNYSMGGLVGFCQISSATISNCYSTGRVTTTCPGTGGLVGNHTDGLILDCYSVSKVSTSVGTPGGLVGGDFGGSVTNSIFNTDSTATSPTGNGATSAQMKTYSTFESAGWDFVLESTNGTNDYWDMDTTNKVINNGYPFLHWQNGGNTALPVEIASFQATENRLSVNLEWKTATEINTNGFEVQRSATSASFSNPQSTIGGSQWISLTFVKAHGTSTAPLSYSYVDPGLAAGTYSYRLKLVDNNGSVRYSPTVNVEVGTAPRVFTLSQNYPNPFNPSTTIEFTLEHDAHVTLKVYDIIGREVATVLDENRKAGEYQQIVFDASRLASGVYFYHLQSGSQNLTKKFVLLK
ncbi:MAG TPA: T9SS type A sorting domain-containing protein [Bacteroidota bacterium]